MSPVCQQESPSQCPSLKRGDKDTEGDERYGRKEGVNEGGIRGEKIRRPGKEGKQKALYGLEKV